MATGKFMNVLENDGGGDCGFYAITQLIGNAATRENMLAVRRVCSSYVRNSLTDDEIANMRVTYDVNSQFVPQNYRWYDPSHTPAEFRRAMADAIAAETAIFWADHATIEHACRIYNMCIYIVDGYTRTCARFPFGFRRAKNDRDFKIGLIRQTGHAGDEAQQGAHFEAIALNIDGMFTASFSASDIRARGSRVLQTFFDFEVEPPFKFPYAFSRGGAERAITDDYAEVGCRLITDRDHKFITLTLLRAREYLLSR
jgi:hypothetical protein